MEFKWNEQFGFMVGTPDCVEECLELIISLGIDYDGYEEIDSLKKLIDELVSYAQLGQKCLKNKKIFVDLEKDKENLIKAKNEKNNLRK